MALLDVLMQQMGHVLSAQAFSQQYTAAMAGDEAAQKRLMEGSGRFYGLWDNTQFPQIFPQIDPPPDRPEIVPPTTPEVNPDVIGGNG